MFLFLHPSVPLFSQIFKGLEICCYGPFTNMPTGKRLGELPNPAPAFPLRHHLNGGSLIWVRYSRGYSISLPLIRQNCTKILAHGKKTSPVPLLKS